MFVYFMDVNLIHLLTSFIYFLNRNIGKYNQPHIWDKVPFLSQNWKLNDHLCTLTSVHQEVDNNMSDKKKIPPQHQCLQKVINNRAITPMPKAHE